MKEIGSKIRYLVMISTMSLRTVTDTMVKPCSDSLRALVDSTSKRKVPTKDNFRRVYFVGKAALTTSITPVMKESGKTPK